MAPSFLPLINDCSNFKITRPSLESAPTSFCLSSDPKSAVGFVSIEVLEALRDDNIRNTSIGQPESWIFEGTSTPQSGGSENIKVRRVHFSEHTSTFQDRTRVMGDLCYRWHSEGLFSNVIGGHLWRSELYPVYINPFGPHDESVDTGQSNKAFEMERCACPLFGVVQFGVHLTIYYPETKGPRGELIEESKMWVATRAKTKQTWPGMLDTSVGGGITAGMTPFEAIIKESMEEGSISEEVVRRHAKAVGAVSYFCRTPNGYFQPEVHYLYDLAVPESLGPGEEEKFKPKPLDGEVELFELLPLSEMIARMHARSFKPNCALVNIDFLIRHGHITSESEPHFLEILTRLHEGFELEHW